MTKAGAMTATDAEAAVLHPCDISLAKSAKRLLERFKGAAFLHCHLYQLFRKQLANVSMNAHVAPIPVVVALKQEFRLALVRTIRKGEWLDLEVVASKNIIDGMLHNVQCILWCRHTAVHR